MICATDSPRSALLDRRLLPFAIAATADRARAALRQRGPAVVLALAIEALVILLFLTLVWPVPAKEKQKPLVFSFDMDGDEAAATETETKVAARPKSGGGTQAELPQPVQPPPEPVPEPPVEWPSNIVWLSRSEYRTTDVKGVRGTAPAAPAQAPGTGGPMAGDTRLANGRGPGGERLYAAEWHVEPTDAQLRTYLAGRPAGWGEIACRTVANYRVEDCVELADWPRGSRLAGAVRQAAWQFRVRPPRIGGKSMVGEWVAIRITYTIQVEKVPGGSGPRREPSDPSEPETR